MSKKITTFGEQLRRLRQEKELPLRKVAAHLDIDPSLLAKFERNERQPSKELIETMAKFFKTDSKELLQQLISDNIAYQIIEENDINILKLAEEKVNYYKKKT